MDRVGQRSDNFPWPNGNSEREAMKLILSTRPLLKRPYESDGLGG